MKCGWSKLGLFVGSVLFGTAGIKILSSKDAKKVYTHTTAAVLRAKDTVMTTVTNVRENAGNILADAKELNEKRVEEAAPGGRGGQRRDGGSGRISKRDRAAQAARFFMEIFEI